MQTRFRIPMMLIVAALVIFSSCSKKSNKEGRYIPKNASVAFLLNGESLSSKLPWEEIKQNEIFKELYADTSMQAYMKTALENPENTGIDTKKNLLFFVQKDSLGGYVAFEGTIKDAAKFKEFNSKAAKDAAETEKDGIHYISTKRITSSWDKEKFVVVIDAPEMDQSSKYRNFDDTSFTPTPAVSKRNLTETAGAIYALSEDNSLAKDEKFTDLVGTKGDIHFWVNIASLTGGSREMAALSMMNVGKLYEGSVMTGVANFDNGKINVDIKSYSGKELSDLYKKYSGTKLDMDMIKRIPSKDVAGLFALSFKPEGLKELIKLTGMEGFINIAVTQLGFTFDDFIKANKGDILVSVSDIKKDSSGKPGMNAIFAASIGDKVAFEKLVAAGNKMAKQRFGDGSDAFVSYSMSDKFFALGTDKPSVNKFLSSANNSNPGFLDKISGASSVFYLNLPVLMTSMSSELSRDSLDNLAFQASIKTWESVIVTGEGFKDGATNMHAEINLVDKNTNSLKQLNKYIETMGQIQQEKKKKMDAWMNENTTSMDESTMAPVEAAR